MKNKRETFRNVHIYKADYDYISNISELVQLSKCKVFQSIMQFAKKNMALDELFYNEKESLNDSSFVSATTTVITAEKDGQIIDIFKDDDVKTFVMEKKGDTFVIVN